MATQVETVPQTSSRVLHTLGVACGVTAGIWLGAAEAPTKFVTIGVSPFLISLGMVCGVFVARWTLPTILKGSGYILLDLREKPHLIIWGLVAGALWAVANTLSAFSIRDVGLAIAFPLWNTSSLFALLWGALFFRELHGAGTAVRLRVLGGGLAVVVGALLLGHASSGVNPAAPGQSTAGVIASLGAAALWGTMFLTYRKAYISGMNPLSFVTVFSFGELITMTLLAVIFRGGKPLLEEVVLARPALFWLFLGGFCWVIGDLFAQYAAKYIGIGRTVPLMCTSQLWGLAWGALVFGELAGQSVNGKIIIIGGSVVMMIGAIAISFAVAPEAEQRARQVATSRECERYNLDVERIEAALTGSDILSLEAPRRRSWENIIVVIAMAIFLLLLLITTRPPFELSLTWTAILVLIMLGSLFGGGYLLWKRTRFS